MPESATTESTQSGILPAFSSLTSEKIAAAHCSKSIPANTRRKREFQIATEFRELNGKGFVVKRAGAESKRFLLSMLESEARSRHFFGNLGAVVSATQVGEVLVYDYIPHPSIHELIGQKLRERNEAAGLELLVSYAAFIKKLPSARRVPRGFFSRFKLSQSENEPPIWCLTAGPIDLIPSNILIHHDQWFICDNEFFFEFEAPVDLVIYRGVATLVNRLQNEIRSVFAPESLIPFSGYGRNRVFIPDSWINLLRFEVDMRLLAEWSGRFEQTILQRVSRSYLRPEVLQAAGQKQPAWASSVGWLNWVVGQVWFKTRQQLGL